MLSTSCTRRATVRDGFSEDAVWRPALPTQALYLFVIDGPLDAPDIFPAGGVQKSTPGGNVRQQICVR